MADDALVEGKPSRLTSAGLAWIEIQAAGGRTQAEIGARLQLNQMGVCRLLRRQPEAGAAYRRGVARAKQSPGALVVPSSQGRALALTSTGIDEIRSMASLGFSKRSIASALGIPHQTFGDTLARQPEAAAAWEAGHSQLEQQSIARLIRLADEGSIAAAIFIAKNVCGWSDTGPKDGSKATTNVVINLPGAMSREQYIASIETSGEASDDA